MYIDTHCHLNDEQLLGQIDEILANCKALNIGLIIVPSYTIESAKIAVELSQKYEMIYCAIGFHPTEIKNYTEQEYAWLDQHLDDEKVLALGEVGLDYHWDTTTKEEQREAFIKQIGLAKKHHKPLIIHSRDAIQDTLDILKEEGANEVGGIMHSYAGSAEMAKEFIKENFMISLGGPLTFLNAKTPKEVCQAVALDYLLAETDSPYLAPHPLRGTKNNPMNVILVYKKMAEIKNVELSFLQDKIQNNVYRLFNLGVNYEKK